ncbi:MAG: flagellar FlbD family protein [Nitriliruptoraceae bacterium]
MILVHRFRGDPAYVNADLIESVEATPDTALTLVDGRRLLVTDTPEEVVERFVRFRAGLLVTADHLRAEAAEGSDGRVGLGAASDATAPPSARTDPAGNARQLTVVPDGES